MESIISKKLIEKLERRKRNTEKGKKEVIELLDKLSDFLSDSLGEKFSFFPQTSTFFIKEWRFDKYSHRYFIGKADCRLCLVDGELQFYYVDWNGYRPYPKDNLIYINFRDFIQALKEFLEELEKIQDWEKEVKILSQLLQCLS